jgi:hypothetical protein
MFYVIAKIYIFIAFALSKRKKMFYATLATKEKHTRKHLYNFFEIWITGGVSTKKSFSTSQPRSGKTFLLLLLRDDLWRV